MEISSGRPLIGGSTTFKPAQKKNDSRAENGLDAGQAERDAARQIAQSNERVEDARRNADVEVDRIKDDHDRSLVAESARNEAALEKEQAKGYESVRDLRRQQQAEMSRVRREGERDLATAKTYYEGAIHTTEKNGAQSLDGVRKQTGQMVDHEKKLSDMNLADLQRQNDLRVARAREIADEKFQALNKESRDQYQKLSESTAEATERSTKHFNDRFQSTLKEQAEVIGSLENRAGDQIKQIRQDTAQKLSAYASRQRDPFYKMVELDAKVHDAGENYVLTATIPEYEQKNVSVTLKGNNLVVSGHRRNEEKLDLSPGHSKGTATFQSFSESFPLPAPVDGKKLERTFDGDQLIVSVPKKPMVYEAHVTEAPPSKTKVQKPHFPENIPHVEREPEEEAATDGNASPKTIGSRTLT